MVSGTRNKIHLPLSLRGRSLVTMVRHSASFPDKAFEPDTADSREPLDWESLVASTEVALVAAPVDSCDRRVAFRIVSLSMLSTVNRRESVPVSCIRSWGLVPYASPGSLLRLRGESEVCLES